MVRADAVVAWVILVLGIVLAVLCCGCEKDRKLRRLTTDGEYAGWPGVVMGEREPKGQLLPPPKGMK